MTSAMRLSRYTKTPISYFLKQPIDIFIAWIQTMNKEIERENQAIEKSKEEAKKKRKKK